MHPLERLSVEVFEGLLKSSFTRPQADPGAKERIESRPDTRASSLYAYLENRHELMKTRELCALIRWNPELVYKLIEFEGLPAHRIRGRGHWKFYLPEVGAWIRSRDEVCLRVVSRDRLKQKGK